VARHIRAANEGGTTKAYTPFVLLWDERRFLCAPHGAKVCDVTRQRIERVLPRVLRTIYLLRLLGWRVVRPITLGVRMIVVRDDEVLLVRSHGDARWHLPGGAVKRGETLAEGACREVEEETGFAVEVDGLLGVYSNFSEYKNDHMAIFWGHPVRESRLKLNLEIAEAGFFPLHALPPIKNRSTEERIDEYATKQRGVWGRW
jgi:ADP-ribose pyrophosphatase YjhB (NUDIX family)